MHQDYLFVTEVHDAPLPVADSGEIHVFRWKEPSTLTTCPAQPALPSPPAYLGSFGGDHIPRRLLVDEAHDQLIVGATSKTSFPIIEGALLFYDLSSFDPNNPADLDNHVTDATPDDSIRVTYPNIYDLLLDGDALYVVDFDNGLYQYSFSQEAYVRYYPAHRGTTSQTFVPQMVLSPEGVIPLDQPVAVAVLPSGRVIVQEQVSGRVAILRSLLPQTGAFRVYVPLLN